MKAGCHAGHSCRQCTLESGPPAQKWHGHPDSPSLRMFRIPWVSAQFGSADRLRLLEENCPRQDRIASAFKFPLKCPHTSFQWLPSTSPFSISRMTLVALDLCDSGWRDSLLRRRVTLVRCASRSTCSNGVPNNGTPVEEFVVFLLWP